LPAGGRGGDRQAAVLQNVCELMHIPMPQRVKTLIERCHEMKRLVYIALLAFSLSCQAVTAKSMNWGKALESAQDMLTKGRYQSAYTQYQRAAAHNPLAQFMLGMFHQNGWGRARNPGVACAWFEKAANRHIPAAEHFWGDCLAQGIGRETDIPSALAWYQRAAAHGHLISWCSAADYYIQGKGVAKDAEQALTLCRQAAQADSPPAMLKLAHYYQDGRDIPQDLAAARYWYQEAAQRRIPEAQYQLGVMLAQGDGGQPDLNAALFWLENAATAGYAPAYLPTAMLYANAPAQEATGALAPEHLAKVYLWNTAAKARAQDPAQRAEVEKLEAQVLAVMPATWRPDLDKQVAQHLASTPSQ